MFSTGLKQISLKNEGLDVATIAAN